MRIVAFIANRVKFFSVKNRLPLLPVIAAGLTALAIGIPRFVLEPSSAHGVNPSGAKPQGCCANVPASLRRMIGTYYTTEDNFKSTLILNNKGPHQIVVTPILHGKNGETYKAPPVSVGGQSSFEADLNAIAENAGSKFRSGGIEFGYTGRMMEMGGGLRIVNAEKSLIFDEQFLEPGMKFSSPQLEAVFAIPVEGARVSVIVSNTTSQPVLIKGEAVFAGHSTPHPIPGVLKPYETQVVNLPVGQIKEALSGAVSLNHNGEKGALMAMIHVQNSDKGYSESVNFHDPAQGKTNQWHGAGLRLGSVNNDALRPVIVVRNISKDATTVSANVPYSLQNGKMGKFALPQLSLAPGEIKLFDTSNSQLRQKEIVTAGLEIEYKGAPGSVIASANSVSQSGNQVFALPLKDPQGGLSSTGGYPWFINGSSSTVVFIKNVTSEQQEFMLDIIYSGGHWGSNVRTLAPGQIFALDVRKLRDAREKGSDGSLIPPDATSGYVSWSLRGNRKKVLIGRAQTVDFTNGLASTYECQCLCGWVWSEARLLPGTATGFPGDVTLFQVQSRYTDCFGNDMGWHTLSNDFVNNNVAHSSDDPNVATLTSPATGTAVAPGSTYLRASWTEWYDRQEYIASEWTCVAVAAAAACAAFCEVQCRFPTSEDTIPTGWDAIAGSKHKFVQRLLPVDINFAGRRVTEQDHGGGVDTCWFINSERDPFNKVTGGTWTVQPANEWGPDVIGYSPVAVSYYRQQGRTPCSTGFYQRMVINCPGNQGLTAYLSNPNYIFCQINSNSVIVTRAEEWVQRTY